MVNANWNRHNPVIIQSLLMEVISKNAHMLYARDYLGLFRVYEREATERNYRPPTMMGFTQVVKRKVLEWEKILKDGGSLS